VVTNRDAAGLIHCRASHPTEIVCRSKCSLLEEHWIRRAQGLPGRIPQLVPPNSDTSATRNRVVNDERFMVAEIPIAQTIHYSIAQTIELIAGAGLWDADAASARTAKRRHTTNTNWTSQSTSAGGPIDRHSPEVYRGRRYAQQQVWFA